MALSPFSARLSLIAFVAIGCGVGANLLALQSLSGDGGKRGRLAAFDFASDSERLRQLTSETAMPSEAPPEPTPRARTPAAKPGSAVESGLKRIGSFAPSSGQIALAALPGADPSEARRATIRGVQGELARRGYEPGPPDGAAGLVTRAAVLAYEHDQGLPLTAEPSPEVLAHLRHGTSAPGAAIGLEPGAIAGTGQAEQVIKAVQQALAHLGYLTTLPDGMATDETVRAIREFEMDSGLVPTGRISGPLAARLARHIPAPPAKR